MTLAPSRLLGPRLQLTDDERWVLYELEPVCHVPGCYEQPERGSHHIEPRSRTGGPVDFIVIDGLVVPNRVRLCQRHHWMITGDVGGHKARIVWHAGWWWWCEKLDLSLPLPEDPEWHLITPLRRIEWQMDAA